MGLDLISDYGTGDENIETLIDTMDVYNKNLLTLSLTNDDNDSQPEIQAGSIISVNGDVYYARTNTAISTTDPYTSSTIVTGTIYIMLGVESGLLTAYFTNTAPTWNNSLQGWYGSGSYTAYRYVAWMEYDAETLQFLGKRNLIGNNSQIRGQIFDYDKMWSTKSAVTNTWRSICYGNGLFVAVSSDGTGNRVMTSSDGISWVSRSSSQDNNWWGVCYGNELFVAVSLNGTNRVMTSPDGINWTNRTASTNRYWTSICYGEGLFVAVASSAGGTGGVMTSPDGITWTDRTATSRAWESVCYGDGLFVAVAAQGTVDCVMTSPDGITWTDRTGASTNFWRDVCYGNGTFVAVADSGTNRVMTSSDGITWTTRTPIYDRSWESVIYDYVNKLFIAAHSTSGGAAGNKIMASYDGITWYDISTPTTYGYRDLCFGGEGIYVAISTNNVMISKYGIY